MQGFSKETTACLLRSIESPTLCAYLRAWKTFADWCHKQKVYYSTLSIRDVCAFLVFLFKKGHTVSFLNIVRSGLSFFLCHLFVVGENLKVKRLFRFFWKRRPRFPRYLVTWDICKVLRFLSSWHPINQLSFKQLTLKTVTLVAITSSDRAQTLESIDIEFSEITNEGIYFPIYSLLKTSKRNRPVRVVRCVRFDEPSLDICNYVVAYLQRSLKYRIKAVRQGHPKPRNLFLSYYSGKPLKRATIAKYITDVLSLAGINTKCFKAHTTRGALPSVMSRSSSPEQILNQGDWTNLGTFKRFYERYQNNSVEGRLIQRITGLRN